MIKRLNQGFTLIELMVVIGIIGVLSSIVLVSLNSARGKGANAVIKSSLANARSQAELFNDVNGTNGYNGVCGVASVNGVESIRRFVDVAHAQSRALSISISYNLINGQTVANYPWSKCTANSTAWAASIPLKELEVSGATTYYYYCVDSTGTASVKVNPVGTATVCPAI